METKVTVVDGYEKLFFTLTEALNRAQVGKGLERHSSVGEPFHKQIGMEITNRVGLGFPLGQALKKIVESGRLPNSQAREELLDTIVYLGMAIIHLEYIGDNLESKRHEPEPEPNSTP